MNFTFKKSSAWTGWTGAFLILGFLDLYFKFLAVRIFRNYNFAFSLPMPKTVMFVVYFLVLALIVKYLYKNFVVLNFVSKIGWFLVLLGALLNIGERLVLGYVRDWIFIWNGVFNLADAYIVFGLLLMLFSGAGKGRGLV